MIKEIKIDQIIVIKNKNYVINHLDLKQIKNQDLILQQNINKETL